MHIYYLFMGHAWVQVYVCMYAVFFHIGIDSAPICYISSFLALSLGCSIYAFIADFYVEKILLCWIISMVI